MGIRPRWCDRRRAARPPRAPAAAVRVVAAAAIAAIGAIATPAIAAPPAAPPGGAAPVPAPGPPPEREPEGGRTPAPAAQPTEPLPLGDPGSADAPGATPHTGTLNATLPPGAEAGATERDFGPVLLIERIDVTGNTATQEAVIRRALPIAAGDVLRASDPRLREARFKLLALGFFRDVALAMHKGSVRGQVVVGVRVVERGTIVLNRLWLGTSALSPTWLGADVSERNLLGLGIGVGGGFVYSSAGAVAGARSQWALELRGAEPSVLGTRWGVQGAITLVRGSEPYRVSGEGAEPALGDLRAFSYRRFGARAGAVYNATALTRLGGSVRVEQITASLPVAPVRELPDGRAAPIDLHLEPGDSRVVTAGLSFDRDTRPDPILPHSGSRLAVSAEVGARALGSEYQYAALLGRYERHWPLLRERHAIALKLAGGVVLGRAPQPDRIHVADVNRMLTPRALGLVLSAAAPLDVLGTRAEKATYGDVGGAASVEYSLELFRGRGSRRVYGGDLYVAVGAWGLAGSGELRARDTSLWRALPIDLFADAGLRIDTDIGIFEVAIANGLGRLR